MVGSETGPVRLVVKPQTRTISFSRRKPRIPPTISSGSIGDFTVIEPPSTPPKPGETGRVSSGVEFFRLQNLLCTTMRCQSLWRLVGEGGEAAFCPDDILRSRVCGILRISIRTSFDYRMDFAYCALSGFDRF
ncbi:hypothetical protein L3X38_017167 [Prunus dulcis]|uniref:Uncharacterized protein n=1 Tax=Prunus dulcis TaxID=3755 RepID=A0AAD4Z9T1_PRUDU|nr:hypothetical protein L3X38_017167 [Prunus dulcis]